MREVLAEASRIEADDEAYAAAVRDWARHGAASEFVLTPDEVMTRSGRDARTAEAAAHFGLAQHLHRAGRVDAAVPHFRRAHRLYPENIAYKRQAWSLATPGDGPFARGSCKARWRGRSGPTTTTGSARSDGSARRTAHALRRRTAPPPTRWGGGAVRGGFGYQTGAISRDATCSGRRDGAENGSTSAFSTLLNTRKMFERG